MAKAASTSLNNCVNCLPGLREVDQIVKHVSTVSIKLTANTQVGFLCILLILVEFRVKHEDLPLSNGFF